ncbi:MAG: aminotransferase class I/II-fold pyridoxal phosphate-dependent enzyme [Chloroflexi bacterium]|nr:aminotransferase class I/II-fold pyridoxal phosphate-dependent enzyme [Chloroflexota bacterium]
MQIAPFKLERYFAEYEFKAQYLLCPSDCESLSLLELLQMADPDGLALWENLGLGYTETPGHPLLRAEVARMYETMTPDDVLIAAPEEAIFIAMHTLLKPGDHVVAISPAYQSLSEIAHAIGGDVTPWSFELRDNHWQLDLDQLARLLTERTRLIVLNFPHNPTGYLPTRDELDTMVDLARQRGAHIFSDEMYRLLEYDPARRLPAMCDLYEKGISLSGLSKTFALPGLRIGWLATRERAILDACQRFKDYTTICNSAPSEILGIIALRAKEKIIARNLTIIHNNLEIAAQFFAEHANRFTWLKPHAGSVAFPRWIGGTSVEQFCADMRERQSVMIVPGSIFDFPGDHFRVGLGRRNFVEAIERVAEYLQMW